MADYVSGFNQRIWQVVAAIPPGKVATYGQGRISLPEDSDSHAIQRDRLEEEGIPFSTGGKIDLRQYGW